ncbi:MAG: hypothetical protein H6702_02425 [Myxococcales bacterium]|nr:hypothetical protein [Myxococcales bacterium]
MLRPQTAWLTAALWAFAAPALATEPTADPAAAEADGKPKPKTGVSSILRTLDWGAGSAQVLDLAKADIHARFEKRFDAARGDTFAIDRLMRERRDEVKAVEDTLVNFAGGRSGYEASIVADEYRTNAGESMLRIDDAAAQRYYFFKDGALWKIVVAYNTTVTRSVKFTDFVKQVKGKNGRPTDMEWATPPGGTRTLKKAIWADDLTQLEVEDRSEFFGTFVMRFIEKNNGVALDKGRRREAPAGAGSDAADGMLADIMGAADGSETANVVDELTGSAHNVDLSRGATEQEVIRRDPAPAKGRKKRGGKAAKKRAAEPEPQPADGGDVIIY